MLSRYRTYTCAHPRCGAHLPSGTAVITVNGKKYHVNCGFKIKKV